VSARHDEHAEQALLGLLIAGYGDQLRNYRAAAAVVTRADFWLPAHQSVWQALEALFASGATGADPVVIERVMRKSGTLKGAGGAVYLAELVHRAGVEVTLLDHAHAIADAATLRRLAMAGQRIAQRAEEAATEPAELSTWATEQVAAARNEGAGVELLTRDARTWFDAAAEAPPAVIPGLLGQGDRLVLTGSGGLGKSTLLAQIALCAAAGLPPLRYQHDDPFDPVRVTIFDCENVDYKRKTRYYPIIRGLERLGLDPWPHLTIGGTGNPFDLLNAQNAMSLLRSVEHDKPQLVYIGPVYKLHNDDPDKEIVVKKITGVLDAIREMGAALITEAHPNNQSQHGGPMRPSGSGLWTWWPEFGMGLRLDPDSDDITRRCKLERWRIDRDENAWPLYVQASGDAALPWMEAPVVPGYLVSEGDPGYASSF
jgi:hypothetical protein